MNKLLKRIMEFTPGIALTALLVGVSAFVLITDNLFFQDDKMLGAVLTSNMTGSTSMAVLNAKFDAIDGLTATIPGDTDDLSEGSTNLYYTLDRVNGRIYAVVGATTSLPNLNITESQISDFGTYLTAESDPIWLAASSSYLTITGAVAGYDVLGQATSTLSSHTTTYNHANYDTAYGWGDHSTAGYFDNITDFTGTLTDTKYCIYTEGTGIVCNSEGGGSSYTPNTASTTVVCLSPDTCDFVATSSDAQLVINRALDFVNGGTVLLKKGQYNITGPILVSDNDNLVGEGISATIIYAANGLNGDMLEPVSTGANTYFVTIRNMTFDGNKANQSAGNCIDGLYAHTWLVEDNHIKNCKNNGIRFQGNASYIALNNKALNNRIEDTGGTGMQIGAYAPNNHVRGNIIGGTDAFYCIELANTEINVTGNHLHGCASHGINVTADGYNNFITNNFIENLAGGGGHGIYVEDGGDGNRIAQNVIFNNNNDGININSSYNGVFNNRCFDRQAVKTQDYGISAGANSSDNIFSGNNLTGNATAEWIDAGTNNTWFANGTSTLNYVYGGIKVAGRSVTRTATKVVCASNAQDKAQCDYLADGTADQVQIQAAIDDLPATGGTVVLSDGVFNTNDEIFWDKNAVTLMGQGVEATEISCSSSTVDAIRVGTRQAGGTYRKWNVIKDMTVNSHDDNNTKACIKIDGGGEGTEISRVKTVDGAYGLQLMDIDRGYFSKNYIENPNVAGFSLEQGQENTMGTITFDANSVALNENSTIGMEFKAATGQTSPNYIDRVNITSMLFYNTSGTTGTVGLKATLGVHSMTVQNSIFENTDTHVNLLDESYIKFLNNTFMNVYGTSADTLKFENDTHLITVEGNRFQAATNIFNGVSGWTQIYVQGGNKNNGGITNTWAGQFGYKSGIDLFMAGTGQLNLGSASDEFNAIYSENMTSDEYCIGEDCITEWPTGSTPALADTYMFVGNSSNEATATSSVTMSGSIMTLTGRDLKLTGGKNPTFTIKSDDNENSYFRYGEVDDFRGGFFNYDGSINTMSIGVHEAFDTNPANDIKVINIPRSSGLVGIGVIDPDTQLEVLKAGTQLKLSYDGTDNATFAVDTNGDLTIDVSGSKIIFTDTVDVGGGTLEIPNGTNPTANDPGELAHDTTDNQLILDDYVIRTNERIFGFCTASTSDFYKAGTIPVIAEKDGYTVDHIECYVTSGTSVQMTLTDGTNAMDTITCGTTVTDDDGSIANSTVTASEIMKVTRGTITGSVDGVCFSVFGLWTRE
jgi:hypothetical protein